MRILSRKMLWIVHSLHEAAAFLLKECTCSEELSVKQHMHRCSDILFTPCVRYVLLLYKLGTHYSICSASFGEIFRGNGLMFGGIRGKTKRSSTGSRREK